MSSPSSDRHRFHLPAVALLAMSIGAGLLAAPPAQASHDDGPSFHFSFGYPPPPPPVAVYGPPPMYYYSPAPRIVIQDRPYYRDWRYRERHHPRHEGRYHRHRTRPHDHDHE